MSEPILLDGGHENEPHSGFFVVDQCDLVRLIMTYEVLRHTADLRLRITAATLPGLFEEAVRGMVNILSPKPEGDKQKVRRSAQVQAPDRTTLLVDFLNEVLTQAQINKEIYRNPRFKKFGETELEVELEAVPVDGFDEDIKAVTYHEAEIKQNESGQWEVTLIFDI